MSIWLLVSIGLLMLYRVLDITQRALGPKPFCLPTVFTDHSYDKKPGKLVALDSLLSLSVFLSTIFYPAFLSLGLPALLLIDVNSKRGLIGRNGADQMAFILLVALTLNVLFRSESIQFVCALFVLSQLVLSYFTAGIYKFVSPDWNKSDVVLSILSTRCYGGNTVASLVSRCHFLGDPLRITVIFWEMAAPLIFVLPKEFAFAYFTLGTAFHASTAALMGLNTFFIVFISAYCFVTPLLSAYW